MAPASTCCVLAGWGAESSSRACCRPTGRRPVVRSGPSCWLRSRRAERRCCGRGRRCRAVRRTFGRRSQRSTRESLASTRDPRSRTSPSVRVNANPTPLGSRVWATFYRNEVDSWSIGHVVSGSLFGWITPVIGQSVHVDSRVTHRTYWLNPVLGDKAHGCEQLAHSRSLRSHALAGD